MITRLPSIFFMLALAAYYIPKILNKYNKYFTKLHIIMGTLSGALMCIAMYIKIGTPDLIKYITFSVIMILIGLTGVGILRKKSNMRRLHIISTLGFFVYLFIIIIL